MENSQDAAAIQAQIAALQAQLQEILAQPAPEPEVEGGQDDIESTHSLLTRVGGKPVADQWLQQVDAVKEEAGTEASMPEAVEQSLAKGGRDDIELAHGLLTRTHGKPAADQWLQQVDAVYPPVKSQIAKEPEADWQDQEPTGPDDPRYAEPEAEPEPEADWQDQEPTGPDDPRYAEPEPAAAAPDQALLDQLFLDAHGGPFDPASDLDGGKMKSIQELLASGQDFGDLAADEKARTRFALQLYRQ